MSRFILGIMRVSLWVIGGIHILTRSHGPSKQTLNPKPKFGKCTSSPPPDLRGGESETSLLITSL